MLCSNARKVWIRSILWASCNHCLGDGGSWTEYIVVLLYHEDKKCPSGLLQEKT